MQPLPRAVEMIRVSTQEQADRDTPELQRRALDRLRAVRPCVVVVRIEELGVSGALPFAERVQLRELKRLSVAKAYDELRVYAVDRLTRAENLRERMEIWSLAQEAGAVIVDANGTVLDPKTDLGEVGYYLQTFAATTERRRLIARTVAGRKRAAEEGRLIQGLPPFGRTFDPATRSWSLVPEQVATYRRIVELCLKGVSTRSIAGTLNAEGASTARGRSWHYSTVKWLLSQPTIIGRYKIFGFESEIPPIIDEVTWARVRTALDRRRLKTGPVPTIEALLRQRMTCAGCGQGILVVSCGKGSAERGKVYYRCASSYRRERRQGLCPMLPSFRVSFVDAAVRAELINFLVSPKILRAAAEAAQRRRKSPGQALASELDRLARQEAQVLRLLGDSLLTESVARDRLGQIRAVSAETEKKQRALVGTGDPVASYTSDLNKVAASIGRAATKASPTQLRALLGILVPEQQPFGLLLSREGLMMNGRLPLDAAGVSELARDTAASAQIAHVPFRLQISLRKAS
mgnify:FL=1